MFLLRLEQFVTMLFQKSKRLFFPHFAPHLSLGTGFPAVIFIHKYEIYVISTFPRCQTTKLFIFRFHTSTYLNTQQSSCSQWTDWLVLLISKCQNIAQTITYLISLQICCIFPSWIILLFPLSPHLHQHLDSQERSCPCTSGLWFSSLFYI